MPRSSIWARLADLLVDGLIRPTESVVSHVCRDQKEERGIRSLATRFSAKEAFSKAIGLGMRTPMTWRGCEVAKQPSGKPEIRLHGALADWFATRRLRAHVSVTDEAD